MALLRATTAGLSEKGLRQSFDDFGLTFQSGACRVVWRLKDLETPGVHPASGYGVMVATAAPAMLTEA